MALVPVSKVCGSPIIAADGETLGSIVEMMLDEDDGSIAYAVLSYGGTLGVGEKLFAVPWAKLSPAEKGFTLEVARSTLDQSDGFDKDAWPIAADPIFS